MKKIIIGRKLSKDQFMSHEKTCTLAPFYLRLLTLCHTPRAFPLGTSQLAHVTNYIGIFKRGVSI